MKIFTSILILAIILSSCGNKETEPKAEVKTELEEVKLPKQNFTETEIAKYTISAIMHQPYEILNVKNKSGIYYVSYTRKDDRKKFDYKIKINGKNITWGNSDGRWRETQFDEKIKYSEKGNVLTITQTFEDGSSIVDSFKKTE